MLLLAAGMPLMAQVPLAVVSGRVTDARTGQPLPGATIMLLPSDPVIGTTTDTAGHFRFTQVPVGIYMLQVDFLSYVGKRMPDLWLRAGKEVVQEVALEPALFDLAAFTVSGLVREEPGSLGARALTVEQSLRYPAMFFDPVRVAGTTPGVVVASDQANHLIVRGNSPNANAWTLEGAEIVSPNHLSNAGTQTDKPTLSGGGVNILSAQMLGTSRFLAGSFPVDRGNAVGGLLDMRLRPGATQNREWTAQAGLLGIDLSTEGPFRKGGRASYLVNYRYSTLGLLGAMGVDLGDEAITFQDLSFHVVLPFRSRGELRLFGMGGTSSNLFEAQRDTSTWEFDKDSRDITYTSRTGAVGGVLVLPVGARGNWRTTVALSATEQEREEVRLSDALVPSDTSWADLAERKLSLVSNYEGSLGARLRYGLGVSAMERSLTNLLDEDITGWLLRPYAFVRWSITDRLRTTVGMGWSQFTFNNSEVWEPRVSLQWLTSRGALAASYGRRSMLPWQQGMNVFLVPQITWNEGVGLLSSEDLVLGYDHHFSDRHTLHAEAFHQWFVEVPVNGPSYPMGGLPDGLNVWDDLVFMRQSMQGRTNNSGVEAAFTHSFMNGFFYQVNTTIYQSLEERVPGTWKDTRWNGNYVVNALGGAEFRKEREAHVRAWGISARVLFAGGMRYTPFVVERRTAGVFLWYGDPWSAQLQDVFRMDLRVYLKRDRKGRTGMWALDLQNATNARNEAFVYYDRRKDEVVTRYQLGLIPNLSYRIEF